jgi:hypothetical protein
MLQPTIHECLCLRDGLGPNSSKNLVQVTDSPRAVHSLRPRTWFRRRHQYYLKITESGVVALHYITH